MPTVDILVVTERVAVDAGHPGVAGDAPAVALIAFLASGFQRPSSRST